MGQPKFEIFKGKNDEFYFHLKAGNGEVILASQGYNAKSSCKHGIDSVINNSNDESNFEKLQAKNERYYFNLIAANKQIVGTSQMYTTTSARDHGIHSVHDNATQASHVDLTKE
jgi:uncharacterized protein YegP (UPF0339 family)